MQLAEVAGRLYALTPAEFTEARNGESARARQAGDAALAGAIRSLRKPSTSAWLVNLLAREDPGGLDGLLELGAALRAAQDQLAGDELRRLSRERHQLVRTLTASAGRLAVQRGHRVADATAREVAATLEAALADEGAAAAVRSGRLIRAVTPSGFDAVDLDGAVAVPEDLPAAVYPRLRAVRTPPGEHPGPATAAEQAVDEARESAAVAERVVVRAESALASAGEDAERARARVDEAERALQEARRALASAVKTRAAVTRDRDAAVGERDAAQRALDEAEDALTRR